MFEVEMKFRVEDPDSLKERFGDVEFAAPVEETDLFFRHPARDFTKTDECLRLRRRKFENGREEHCVTYKGPKIDRTTKTRREIELPVESISGWTTLFEALGFEPGPGVRKIRRYGKLTFENRTFEILLDLVPGLSGTDVGPCFVELETLAEADELEAAREAVIRLAKCLDLGESIRTSYLGLLSGRAKKEP